VNRSIKRSRSLATLRIAAALLGFVVFATSAKSALAARPRVGLALTGSTARAPVHEAISATLSQHGFELVDVDAEDGQDATVAAKSARLVAVLVGEARSSGRCALLIYNASGDVIGKASWAEKSGSKLGPAVRRTLWTRVGDALTKVAATATPASSGAQEADDDERALSPAKAPAKKKAADSADDDEEGAPGRKRLAIETTAPGPAPAGAAGTALDLAVGMRLFSRNLTFSPGGTALRDFSVSGRSALGIAGAWYPAAAYRADWLSNLGVGAAIEWVPGLDSVTSGGVSYPTTAADLRADVRYRLLLSNGGQIAFAVGGGQQSFVFRSDGTAQRTAINDLPDVQYSYLRVGVDARIVLPADLSLLLAGGYRYVPSAGKQDYLIQESSYLPGSSVVAFDVGAGVGYRFASTIEARAGFDLRRYQFSGGTNAGSATSASDQYTAFWLQVAFLLDGIGATEDHAPAKPRHDDESE
jgi:hypothetical protein